MSRRLMLLTSLAALLILVGAAALNSARATTDDSQLSTATPATLPDRILGKKDAPITVEEYVSLTCPHCADFTTKTLPEIEKKYVDTGKVKFILRDYPLDGIALKAAILARCMPEDMFYPFIKTLYSSLKQWSTSTNPEQILLQYAKLGGLSEDKAKACLADKGLQSAIIAERTQAADKFSIQGTPAFIINYGAEKFDGEKSVEEFSAMFDKLLAKTKP